jgi:hypothetical protein
MSRGGMPEAVDPREFLVGVNFEPHLIIERALFTLLRSFYTTNSTGERLLFRGSIDCSTCTIPNAVDHMDTVLRTFGFCCDRYQYLGPEHNYVGNNERHHSYLRTVVSAAVLAYWIQFPNTLVYQEPFNGEVDLTRLPSWASRVLRRVKLSGDYTVQFFYNPYDQIAEE